LAGFESTFLAPLLLIIYCTVLPETKVPDIMVMLSLSLPKLMACLLLLEHRTESSPASGVGDPYDVLQKTQSPPQLLRIIRLPGGKFRLPWKLPRLMASLLLVDNFMNSPLPPEDAFLVTFLGFLRCYLFAYCAEPSRNS
jgi:hypothetical protein